MRRTHCFDRPFEKPWRALQDDPEAIKGKLGDFLRDNGVSYEFSTTTKFGRFRKRQAKVQ